MRHLMRVLSLAAVVLAMTLVGTATGQQSAPASPCADCHDDVAAAFALTPHGQQRPDVPACESCHGDGARHIEEGDPALIAIPSGSDGAATCLTCHGGVHDAFTSGQVHARSDVHCASCHQIHPTGAPRPALIRAETSSELCATCHTREVRSFDRPFGHELGRAGVECVSCHTPHGGPGQRSLKMDRSGDLACMTCHADLRGPHVFPHVAGQTGDCMSCHEPHGSSNPHALTRASVDQLCLECHSPTAGTIGSQPPSVHDLRSPRYRNCTTCHVAVHGSNTSPALLK